MSRFCISGTARVREVASVHERIRPDGGEVDGKRTLTSSVTFNTKCPSFGLNLTQYRTYSNNLRSAFRYARRSIPSPARRSRTFVGA
jgi:hypothetical protein